MRWCSGITQVSGTCTGSPIARSRFSSDSVGRCCGGATLAPFAAMAAVAPQFLLRSAMEHRVNPASSFVTAALLCHCGLIALASAQRLDTTSAAAALPLVPERTTAEGYEPVFD